MPLENKLLNLLTDFDTSFLMRCLYSTLTSWLFINKTSATHIFVCEVVFHKITSGKLTSHLKPFFFPTLNILQKQQRM